MEFRQSTCWPLFKRDCADFVAKFRLWAGTRFCRASLCAYTQTMARQDRADGRSHRAFSDAANQRTAKSGPTMRRDDDQIGLLLCSGLMDRLRAVSGNGRCMEWNTIEIDALQESSHLFTTSPARCFGVSERIVIPAGCRHHHRAEVSHVKHDNARTNLFVRTGPQILHPPGNSRRSPPEPEFYE